MLCDGRAVRVICAVSYPTAAVYALTVAANAGARLPGAMDSAPSDASPDSAGWRGSCPLARCPPPTSTGYCRSVPTRHVPARHVAYRPPDPVFSACVVSPEPPPVSRPVASAS